MALLEASVDNKRTWFPLPTPSPDNYETRREHLEKSYVGSTGYLNRDIIRRSRNKVFCGYNALDGSKTALLDSLYDYDYFYLKFTNNKNERIVCKVYAGPLEGKASLMNKSDYTIKWRTSVQMNFIEY
ncbi:MAG: hypothetical protein IJO32_00655 [Bacilli bacterium]|nr:hypothetical protein [Bacilli bacterium]